MEFLVKTFLNLLKERVPHNLTYIRPVMIREICDDTNDKEFAKIFRILLHYFLKKGYMKTILLKKKHRLNHLKECRILYQRIFQDDN